MKWKILSAVLLLCCFAWLAVLSGAVPVTTEAKAASAEASQDLPTDTVEGESPPPSPAAEPASPPPTDTPTPAETTAPEPSSPPVTALSTTITGSVLDNRTYYDVDPDTLLAGGYSLPLSGSGYQILIIHTHATEAYTPTAEDPYASDDAYRSTDPEHSVIRVGQALADALAAYGLNVLHDTQLHDYPSYSGSYARSGDAIAEYLAAYPTIRLVIDLHRDALGDDTVIYKTNAGIDGVDAAQLMFVMGSDVNLEHPDWRENLKLALTLQEAVSDRWPTLMRPIDLCDYRYNQQLAPGSLLLEAGTSGNTMTEAVAAVELFAEAVGPLLASWME